VAATKRDGARSPWRATAHAVEQRLSIAAPVRRALNRIVPDNWSFLLGELTLYSFVVLLLTGVFLTFFFTPSMTEVTYSGSYVPLRGVDMSEAFQSTLRISFDVRGGLLIRQIHHWAALLFIASMLLHLIRVFFTGAFRRPRDLNWLVGMSLLLLALMAGFTGYTLPDDLMSGASLRIGHAIILSIPLIGSWLANLVYGGEFPGTLILTRLYLMHVLLLPAMMLAMLGLHLTMVVLQRHTVPAGTATAVRFPGSRLYPGRLLRSLGLAILVTAVLTLLGGLAQINPIWLFGPFHPPFVSSLAHPDWYMFYLEGALRAAPPWELRLAGHTIPEVFWPGVALPAGWFLVVASYPFVEARFTRDRTDRHELQRPRDAPFRTGLGVFGLTFYVVMSLIATDDAVSAIFHLSLDAVLWSARVALIVLPCLGFFLAYRICRALQRQAEHRAELGVPTGTVVRLPNGDYAELTAVDGLDSQPVTAGRTENSR
jgi:ubiquinol-cytochrome c reductase cytochrome b subunit